MPRLHDLIASASLLAIAPLSLLITGTNAIAHAPTDSTFFPAPSLTGRGFTVKGAAFSARGQQVQLVDVTISDLKLVRVVDMFEGIKVPGYRTYAVSEVVQAVDPALVVSGAGGPSLSLPSSLGLVIDNGRQASQLNAGSEFATGVLCIDFNDRASIDFAKGLNASRCKQGMQSGPLIINPSGTVGIRSDEVHLPTLPHIVVAIDQSAKLHVLGTSAVHLYDLANYLHDQRFVSCLNLTSGLDHSAIVVHIGHAEYTYGNPLGSIPSALVVTQ
jgi:hypothetical protein